MDRLEQLVRDTLAAHEHEAPPAAPVLAEVHRRTRRHSANRWLARLVAAGAAAAVVVLAGAVTAVVSWPGPTETVHIAGGAPTAVTSRLTYGQGSGRLLVLSPPPAGATASVSERRARQMIEHPFAAPALAGALQTFGLADVTISGTPGLSVQGSAAVPKLTHVLAWVGVYEMTQDTNTHGCNPNAPVPASLPPLLPHYYFAVIVNATTGQELVWMEDDAGLNIRRCHGQPLSANPSPTSPRP